MTTPGMKIKQPRKQRINYVDPVGGWFKAKSPVRFTHCFFVFLKPYKNRAFDGFQKQKNRTLSYSAFCFAESKGFEPLVRATRTTVFETAPFDHSGNSPGAKLEKYGFGGAIF